MIIALSLLACALLFSFALNVFLFLETKKKPKKTESLELKEFLGDLMTGIAFVAVTRLDPNSFLLRSPKK